LKKFLLLFCALSLALGITANANAALIVDTGPPSNNWGAYYVGGGQTSQWLAGQFTLAQGYDIYAMQGYLGVNVAGEVQVTIYSDNQGRPDTALFGKTFMSESDQPPYFYGWQGTSGYAGHLDAGTYWIAFGEAPGSSFQGSMGTSPLTSPVMAAEAYNYYNGQSWSGWWVAPQGSGLGVYARIYGNPVPLPGAFWLLGPGLVGLAAIRRRFKK
jgi:hypothetical protein